MSVECHVYGICIALYDDKRNTKNVCRTKIFELSFWQRKLFKVEPLMPLKDGKLTPAERKIAEAYAVSGDVKYAGHAAGLSAISGSAHKALKRPEVQAEIARLQQERLFNDVLPQAVNVHMALLRNPKTPAGALVQAVKLAYDQTLGKEDAARQKEPHEMTPDELATAIAALQRVASDKARPIIEAEPIDADAAEDDIFA